MGRCAETQPGCGARAHHRGAGQNPGCRLGAHRPWRAGRLGGLRSAGARAHRGRIAQEPGQEHAVPRLRALWTRAPHGGRRERRVRGMKYLIFGLAVLLAACSSTPPRSGGYYKDDGPEANPPANLASIPDALPRAEPLHKYANRPYEVFGKKYVPLASVQPFSQRGTASWYGKKFHGQKTSSGETYDMYKMTAAHPTLPIPSYVRVTHVGSGKSVVVRVNDRGPFHGGRIIDLSYVAAYKLGYVGAGSAQVQVEAVVPGQQARRAAL